MAVWAGAAILDHLCNRLPGDPPGGERLSVGWRVPIGVTGYVVLRFVSEGGGATSDVRFVVTLVISTAIPMACWCVSFLDRIPLRLRRLQ